MNQGAFAYAVRKRLFDLERALAASMATVPCAGCGQVAVDHPWQRCAEYIEPEHWPADVRAASASLVQYRSMMVEPCDLCGVMAGAHGKDVLCLCGHPAGLHTQGRLITPKTREVQTWDITGKVRFLEIGEPPYERLYCSRCPRPRWEDDTKYRVATPERKGLCNGYETPPFAERCAPGKALGVHGFKIAGKPQKTKWWAEHDCPWPLPAQVQAWRERLNEKAKAQHRQQNRERQEVNHALISGPVVERQKKR